jgi:hypothetical protein
MQRSADAVEDWFIRKAHNHIGRAKCVIRIIALFVSFALSVFLAIFSILVSVKTGLCTPAIVTPMNLFGIWIVYWLTCPFLTIAMFELSLEI